MKDDILDYVFTQEEILLLIQKLLEKIQQITEEVDALQAQQSKDNETKLADMRVELEEFARQIGVFAQNTKDEQDRLVGELEKLDEVVETKVSDAGADIDAAVDEMEDRIEALRAEIPVLKEKTGSELMSLIGTIPFDRVEGLAEIARQLNSFSEVVHEERSDDSEFVKGELARVEERIDNLPTYEDKFKELNADMYKLSQELVNITPRIEVFVNGNKYASVHRLNFVGSTVTNDNGLVTVTNSGVVGATAWGDITGTLSAQTDLNTALSGKSDTTHNHTGTYAPVSHAHTISDVTGLQTALDGKVDENVAITGATKTKITYDAKGLVTSGADATTADIADSLNKRYVTDANLTVIGNTSGTNTGDETQSTIKTKLGAATASVDGYATSTQITKLDGIAAGAEVNVNADWNAVSGDAQILNKPTIPTQYTDEMAQDAVGGMVDTTLVYTDATPALSRAALTGAITASAGSNTTALGSFTKSQLDGAVSDGNVLYVGDVTSNATHTGDVTGATALTIDKTAITGKTAVTAVGTDYVLISDTSDSGNLKKALASDFAGSIADGDKGDITVTGGVWNIDAATIGTTELSATGTPSSSTYLRGDNTWATPTAAVSSTAGVGATPTASGTVTITHNLGRTPAIIRIYSGGGFTSNAAATPTTYSMGIWNSSGNFCLYQGINGTTTIAAATSNTIAIYMITSAGNLITGVIQNVGATTFDIAFTETGTHTRGVYMWEAQ